jgi:hypothetical protein
MRGMAKSFGARFLGLGLAMIAAASLLLSGFLLVQTWRLKGPVTAGLQSGLDGIASTLTTTANSLTAIDRSLEATSEGLKALQDTAQSAAGSLHTQAASIQSLGSLFSADLPTALTAAQTAMIGAQSGAKAVEDTLTVLTANPAFAATPYQPAIPLSTALAGVADGLGALPGPMQTVGEQLATTSGDITSLENTVTLFATSLEGLRGKLDDARKSIAVYRDEVDTLGTRLESLRAGAPKWIAWAAWLITFLLAWLGLLQLYGVGRGLRWMARGR